MALMSSALLLNLTVEFKSKKSQWPCSVNSSPDSDRIMAVKLRNVIFMSTSRTRHTSNLRFVTLTATCSSYLSASKSWSGVASRVAFTSLVPLNATVQFKSKYSHWPCSVNSSPRFGQGHGSLHPPK